MTFNNEKIDDILLDDDKTYCIDLRKTKSNINKKSKKKIMIKVPDSSNLNNFISNYLQSAPNLNDNIISLTLQNNSGIDKNKNISRIKEINLEKKIKIINKKKSLNKINKTLCNNYSYNNNKIIQNPNITMNMNINEYLNNNKNTNRIIKKYQINKNNIKTKILEYKNLSNESI